MHRLTPLVAAPLWICVSLWAQSPPAPAAKSAFDKQVLEQYVRHLFVWGPQINVAISEPRPSKLEGFKEVTVTASAGPASQQEVFLISGDGKKVVRGTVYDVAKDPFEADQARLKTDGAPMFGKPDTPVEIVIYSDFQCSFCKEEGKIIRGDMAKSYPDQVRVYFKDYPLEPIHPWAKAAAIAGRCVFRQNPAAFWDYHDWIFEHQGDITAENLKEKVGEFAKTKGIEPLQFTTCMDTRATEAEVNQSIAEARALGINSTPTMFVNGRRLVGHLAWQNLKQIIDHEIEYKKTHAGAEKCCEVTLPAPQLK
jgi:protein-disulfide isomerase